MDALKNPSRWDYAGITTGGIGFSLEKYANNIAKTNTLFGTYSYGSISTEQPIVMVDSNGTATVETQRTPIAEGSNTSIESSSSSEFLKSEMEPTSATSVTATESSSRLAPGLVAEGGKVNVTSTITTAAKDVGWLGKTASITGRVLGGPELGATLTAMGGALDDANHGIYRTGQNLWIATTVDSFVGAGISYTADFLGLAVGVGSSPFITPVGGVVAGGATAAGVAWGGGAAWTAIREPVINRVISGVNAAENAYNEVSNYTAKAVNTVGNVYNDVSNFVKSYTQPNVQTHNSGNPYPPNWGMTVYGNGRVVQGIPNGQ